MCPKWFDDLQHGIPVNKYSVRISMGETAMDDEFVNTWPWHFIAALVLSVLTIAGSVWAPNLLPYDSSLSDYFRVTRANHIAKQRDSEPDITLVIIGEYFINQLPYRSPVDRCVLAAGISSIMTLNPKVIGIDFLFDKKTESHKDNLLRQVIQDYQDALVVAVNATDDANINMPGAVKTEDSFSTGEAQASALLKKDADYVVRNALLDDAGVPAFAARLVEKYRGAFTTKHSANEFQIDWLARDSGRGDAFSKMPLEVFLDQSVNEQCAVDLDLPAEDRRQFLRPLLENKIVIIGADLEREDRHITPFDSVWHEKVALSGAEIHANIAQQIIDERSIHNVRWYVTLAILFVSFLASLLIAEKSKAKKWPRYMVLLGPLFLALLLSGVNWLFIFKFGLVLPTGLVAVAIGANVLLELFRDMICNGCGTVISQVRDLLK